MDMMTRRRAMMKSGGAGPLPEWDVEWDYTDGLPDANGLFTMSKTGTAGATLRESDVQLYAKNSGSYIQYTYPRTNPTGVLEVDTTSGGGNNFYFYIALSADGVHGIAIRMQRSTNYQGIYLCDQEALADMTRLATYGYSQNHVVRLEMNAGSATVYDNDNILASDVNIQNIYHAGETYVQYAAASSTQRYGYLYSIKAKFGRL